MSASFCISTSIHSERKIQPTHGSKAVGKCPVSTTRLLKSFELHTPAWQQMDLIRVLRVRLPHSQLSAWKMKLILNSPALVSHHARLPSQNSQLETLCRLLEFEKLFFASPLGNHILRQSLSLPTTCFTIVYFGYKKVIFNLKSLAFSLSFLAQWSPISKHTACTMPSLLHLHISHLLKAR